MNQNKSNRDWVNSPAHIKRTQIEQAEKAALVAILEHNKCRFKIAMMKLAKLYEDK